MIVSALQMQPFSVRKEKNLALIQQAARAAVAAGSSLLVTPEMSVTGYAIWDNMKDMAEPRDGFIASALLKIAKDMNIAITAGMPERDGDVIYNTALCAMPDGDIYFYRKCHLFGSLEKQAFCAGADVSPVFYIGETKVGMLICYDVEFPEWVRTLALKGAGLIIVPTALPKAQANERVSRLMLPTRALENHVSIIYAGLCGKEPKAEYQGGSCILDANGEDLARAGENEALLSARLNPRLSTDFQEDAYLFDRRPEIYKTLIS